LEQATENALHDVLWYALLASEVAPFDPMEKAIWEAYEALTTQRPDLSHKIFEYELEGQPPMMTHVYDHGDFRIVAAKGAAERIVRICALDNTDKKKIKLFMRFESLGI